MPDITRTCASCGTSIQVSEYADAASLKCPGCGKPMAEAAPSVAPPDGSRPRPQLRRRKAAAEGGDAAVVEQPVAAPAAGDAKPSSRVVIAQVKDGTVKYKRRLLNAMTVSWGITILIGLPLAFVRYGDMFDPTWLIGMGGRARTYGPLLVLLFHLLVAAEAFKDEFFLGICALIIPGYSLIYLYTRSENYVVRVAFLLFAITFGPETYGGITDYASRAYYTVDGWITGHEREAGFD